jgi:hypothetical protein
MPRCVVVLQAIPELVDSCIPNLCHGLSLPCGQGAENCLHRRELEYMMVLDHLRLTMTIILYIVSCISFLSAKAEADRFYCERYSGAAGGKNASNLSLYPFVNEVL